MAVENYTSASTDPFTLVPYEIGPGRSVLRARERDAPGFYALISDAQAQTIPLVPETAHMTFSIFQDGNTKVIGSHVIAGRVGLNFWYLANVGHIPDAEPGSPRPILELIDNVAAHMLLRYFTGEGVIETCNDARFDG